MAYQTPSSVNILNSTIQAPFYQNQYPYNYENNNSTTQLLHHRPTSTMSQKIQQLYSNYYIRAYYQYFHDAHPLLLPLQALEGPLGTQHVPGKVITVMKYIGSHFLTISNNTTEQTDSRGHRRRISAEPTQSPGRDDTARHALETEAFSCLSCSEEDGYQVQCMILLSITAHAHGNFLDAIRIIKSATSLALKLGMNWHSFSVTHGYGSPLLEEMWRRCYWELFVVESLLCALIEESAELYGVVSDVPLPCDEGMMDLDFYNVSTLCFFQDEGILTIKGANPRTTHNPRPPESLPESSPTRRPLTFIRLSNRCFSLPRLSTRFSPQRSNNNSSSKRTRTILPPTNRTCRPQILHRRHSLATRPHRTDALTIKSNRLLGNDLLLPPNLQTHAHKTATKPVL